MPSKLCAHGKNQSARLLARQREPVLLRCFIHAQPGNANKPSYSAAPDSMQPCLCDHGCRDGNCKEGLEWELQRGAGVLPAVWDLLLRCQSDCSPSPGLLGVGWFSTRNGNCFSKFSGLSHSFTWLLHRSRRLHSGPALGPSVIAAEPSPEQLSPARTQGRSPAPNLASSGKKRPPANKAIREESALVLP